MKQNEDDLKRDLNSRLATRLVQVKNEIEKVAKLMTFVLPSDKLLKKADRSPLERELEVQKKKSADKSEANRA